MAGDDFLHSRFVAEDGSFVESEMVGEGVDTGDKAMMKAQANALKYAIWYTFAVPTHEKLDSEAFDDEAEVETAPKKTRMSKGVKEMLAKIQGHTTLSDLMAMRDEAVVKRCDKIADSVQAMLWKLTHR